MRIEDLKVGDKVYIKDDLKVFKNYGDDTFVPDMKTGLQEVKTEITEYKNKIKVANDGFYYTSEMIDWEKTGEINKKLVREDTSSIKNNDAKVKSIRDLKSGDKVYIKDDLIQDKIYGDDTFVYGMKKGANIVGEIINHRGVDLINLENDPCYNYTFEMIDWEKTAMLNESIPKKDMRNIKPTYDGTILSLGDLKVIRHRDDNEDLEKAIMMLLLKKEGYDFGDVKRVARNTKISWKPKYTELYYYIKTDFNVEATTFVRNNVFDKARVDANNCFKTKQKAEEKARLMKKILQEGEC